jgi:hypothetical protein
MKLYMLHSSFDKYKKNPPYITFLNITYLFTSIQKYINWFVPCTFNDVILTIKVTHNSVITKSPLIKGCQSLECADSKGAYEKY